MTAPIRVDLTAKDVSTARQLGATDTVDATAVDDVVAAVRELSGGGVDYSFEAIGRKDTAEQAFNMLDLGGTATVTLQTTHRYYGGSAPAAGPAPAQTASPAPAPSPPVKGGGQ